MINSVVLKNKLLQPLVTIAYLLCSDHLHFAVAVYNYGGDSNPYDETEGQRIAVKRLNRHMTGKDVRFTDIVFGPVTGTADPLTTIIKYIAERSGKFPTAAVDACRNYMHTLKVKRSTPASVMASAMLSMARGDFSSIEEAVISEMAGITGQPASKLRKSYKRFEASEDGVAARRAASTASSSDLFGMLFGSPAKTQERVRETITGRTPTELALQNIPVGRSAADALDEILSGAGTRRFYSGGCITSDKPNFTEEPKATDFSFLKTMVQARGDMDGGARATLRAEVVRLQRQYELERMQWQRMLKEAQVAH